jgi:hypothetical protein
MLGYMKNKFNNEEFSILSFRNFIKKIKKFTFPVTSDSDMGLLLLYKINEYKFILRQFDLFQEAAIIDKIIPYAKDNAASYYTKIRAANNIKYYLKRFLGFRNRD